MAQEAIQGSRLACDLLAWCRCFRSILVVPENLPCSVVLAHYAQGLGHFRRAVFGEKLRSLWLRCACLGCCVLDGAKSTPMSLNSHLKAGITQSSTDLMHQPAVRVSVTRRRRNSILLLPPQLDVTVSPSQPEHIQRVHPSASRHHGQVSRARPGLLDGNSSSVIQ